MATRNRAAARSVLPAPDDDAEEIELEDDTRGDVPVVSFGAFEAGDERRYR